MYKLKVSLVLILFISISLKTYGEEKVYHCKGNVISNGLQLDSIECIIKVNDTSDIYKNTFTHTCLTGTESKTEYRELNDPRMIANASVSISSNTVHVKSEFKFPGKENDYHNEFIDFDQLTKKYSGIGKSPFGLFKFYGICI